MIVKKRTGGRAKADGASSIVENSGADLERGFDSAGSPVPTTKNNTVKHPMARAETRAKLIRNMIDAPLSGASVGARTPYLLRIFMERA
ncbi:MAG: hypothetical protein J0H75_15820 [Rhizobiales bacterium]|nr:hypothetical protein [Hyphomicrobiales bacterium]